MANTYIRRGIRGATWAALVALLPLCLSPSSRSQPAPEDRGGQSISNVRDLILREGRSHPDWWDAEPLDYPKTLDLSWPKPKGGWQPQKNVGQYLITVINPHPAKWRGAAKLLAYIQANSKQGSEANLRAMESMGHVYGHLLGDFPRAAYWLHQAEQQKGSLGPAQYVLLADCYWQMGCRSEAARVLRKVSRGSTKLWAEIGELDRALAEAEQESRSSWPFEAVLAGGNACRSYGRYAEALSWYKRVAAMHPEQKQEQAHQKAVHMAEKAIQATEVFRRLPDAPLHDGRYTGAGEGYRGSVETEVVVQGGAIASVKVNKHEEDWFYRSLTEIPRRIVEKQGAEGVHAVTGATKTSVAIVDGVGLALKSALRE